jgi:hypothetical protein
VSDMLLSATVLRREARGDGDGTQPPQLCTRFRLVVDSIDVSAIDDGFLGGNLEAVFTFVVNGQARTYNNQDLGVGVTPIGISFFVDVPVETSTITFTVSGIEQDVFFDDTIAGFTRTFGQAENWGQGFQTGSASDSNITYTLNYTITCARNADVAVSRAALLGYARAKAEQRRVEVPTEHIAIAWALDRFRREGWQVVAATDAQYVLRGPGTLPLLAERRFAGGGD